MLIRTLETPTGYPSQAAVSGMMAAQLDRLLALLRERIAGLSVADLQWQLRPGINTAGMLLAHLALSEVYWMRAAWQGIVGDAAEDEAVRAVLGLHFADDGMPLAASGLPPATLQGKTAADYRELLEKARRATHSALRGFDDARLGEVLVLTGEAVTRAWILHHLVEHFAQHLGQIGLLINLRRRAAEP